MFLREAFDIAPSSVLAMLKASRKNFVFFFGKNDKYEIKVTLYTSCDNVYRNRNKNYTFIHKFNLITLATFP